MRFSDGGDLCIDGIRVSSSGEVHLRVGVSSVGDGLSDVSDGGVGRDQLIEPV